MKKIVKYLIVIFLSFITFLNVDAKEIGAFKCEYDVLFPDAYKYTFFKMQIEVTDFNKSNNVTIMYSEDANSSINKTYANKTVNLYYDASSYFVSFFNSTSTDKFIERFKDTGHCPELYSNLAATGTGFSVENQSLDGSYSLAFSATKEFLREPGSSTYFTSDEFWSNPDPDPVQPPSGQKNCSDYNDSATHCTQAGCDWVQKGGVYECVEKQTTESTCWKLDYPTCHSREDCDWGNTGCEPKGYTPPSQPVASKDLTCTYDMKFGTSIMYYQVIFNRTFNNVTNGYSYYMQVTQGDMKWDKLFFTSLDDTITYYINYTYTLEVEVDSNTLKDILNVDECLASNLVYYYMKNSTALEYVITTNRDEAEQNSYNGVVGDGTEVNPNANSGNGQKPTAPNVHGFGELKTCSKILGSNLTEIVHTGIKALQIIGAILTIVWGMMTLIPAILSKDSDGLKSTEKKLIYMSIILTCIFLLPTLVRFIGKVFGFDLTCLL